MRNGRARDEKGYVAVIFALILTVLVMFAGFAINTGSWYSRANQLQRAADAAALAGVVYMPDLTAATTAARTASARNGVTHGGTITVAVSAVAGNDHQLAVTITDTNVKRWMSKDPAERIVRSSKAEYVVPVPLGSPDNTLGNQSNSDTKNLWASISGPQTDKNNGDPYSTKCAAGSSGSGCSGNTEYRNTGYLYAIEVPAAAAGQSLTLDIWDAGNYARSSYANVEDADNGTVNTSFELFSPTSTPLDESTFTNSAYSLNGKCNTGAGKWTINDGASSTTYKNKFVTLCKVNVATAGVYFLQVKSSNISGVTDSGNGWNQFSLKATMTGSTQAKVYGYGDLSLFNNLQGQTGNLVANFYLAEIGVQYASKTMTVSLFDPGDGASGTYYVNILKPGDLTVGCTYGQRGGSTTTVNPCRIQTRTSGGTNTYNGKWLDITMTIPVGYTCTPNCWWKVKYEFNGVTSGNSPNDRTVWTADISGDPVHLVGV